VIDIWFLMRERDLDFFVWIYSRRVSMLFMIEETAGRWGRDRWDVRRGVFASMDDTRLFCSVCI
jgi:hypothetical protein